MEQIAGGIVNAFINSGPVGLLALISIGANLGLVKWLTSVYRTLGEVQERRVLERDEVVKALQSAADAAEDNARIAPVLIQCLRAVMPFLPGVADPEDTRPPVRPRRR